MDLKINIKNHNTKYQKQKGEGNGNIRDPQFIRRDKGYSRPLQSFGDVGKFVEELRFNGKPEILFPVAFTEIPQPFPHQLLEMLLLIQHELGIGHKEMIFDGLLNRFNTSR